MTEINPASRIKSGRATSAEMEERAQFLIEYAALHGPITVRGLYYQAEVAGLPGIDKTDAGYDKVQAQVLKLRREGRLPYDDIADLTRWMRKPRTFNGVQDALNNTATTYRKALWADAEDYVEVWCEKDALAGVIMPVTSEYDVPLMVARGFASETFCYEAIAARGGDDRPYVVYYLGDFDRAGQDAAKSLEAKLSRFAGEKDLDVEFFQIAITTEQIEEFNLPTREPKRKTPADQAWLHDFACELDAMAPDDLRDLVRDAIELHLPAEKLEILKVAEESERSIIQMFARNHAKEEILESIKTFEGSAGSLMDWWRSKRKQRAAMTPADQDLVKKEYQAKFNQLNREGRPDDPSQPRSNRT